MGLQIPSRSEILWDWSFPDVLHLASHPLSRSVSVVANGPVSFFFHGRVVFRRRYVARLLSADICRWAPRLFRCVVACCGSTAGCIELFESVFWVSLPECPEGPLLGPRAPRCVCHFFEEPANRFPRRLYQCAIPAAAPKGRISSTSSATLVFVIS